MYDVMKCHKFADVIFGITQLHHQTWSDNMQQIREFF